MAANCYSLRPCYKCGRYGHAASNCWGKNPFPRKSSTRGRVNEVFSQSIEGQGTGIPINEPFTEVKEEWSLDEPGRKFVIGNERKEVSLGLENEKKLLHAKALITKERRSITMFIDTESSCNVLQKGYCRKP